MRVLVTGGAGYIGSLLVPALLGRGWRVTVLDSFGGGDAYLAASCADPNFEPVRGDARDMRVLEPLLRAADAVIPLAALVGAPLCARDEIGARTLNRDAVVALVRRASPAQLIAYPATESGYGSGDGTALLTEASPLRPVSLYARTKVEAEAAVLEHANSLSFRLATVFGMAPRMRLDLLVNDFCWRAVTDRAVVLFEARFRRNYIHVRDVAGAFLHGIDHAAAMRGRAYNVGLSDANLSKAELCARIARHVPGFTWMEAPVGTDADQRDYAVSSARLEATGWRPAHSLDDGIAELVKGYRMLHPGRFRQ